LETSARASAYASSVRPARYDRRRKAFPRRERRRKRRRREGFEKPGGLQLASRRPERWARGLMHCDEGDTLVVKKSRNEGG
jgi:hypothetical protein